MNNITSNPKLLIVDDEKAIRTLVSQMTEAFCTILAAGNASEALEKIKQESPDIMISDIKMPGDDGITLLRHVKTQFPEMPVIMITGHGDKELAIAALKNGASDFIEKPFNVDDVISAVKRNIELVKHYNENKNQYERMKRHQDRLEELIFSKAEQLYKSDRELNKIFNSLSEGIAYIEPDSDNDWMIVKANDKFCSKLGIPADNFMRRKIKETLLILGDEYLQKINNAAHSEDQVTFETPVVIENRNRTFYTKLIPTHNEANKCCTMMIIISEIPAL